LNDPAGGFDWFESKSTTSVIKESTNDWKKLALGRIVKAAKEIKSRDIETLHR
jgi:hypothetical protein